MSDGTTPSEESGAPHHPRAVAVLVCDRSIRDTRTGRVSLVDLLDEVSATTFPLVIPPVSVYARLTDATGFYALALEVVRRDDLLEVARMGVGHFEATDPLEDVEIVVHQLQLRLPSVGFYDVRLWANGRFVQSVSFRALS